MKEHIIFDLDGTLANDDHRLEYIENRLNDPEWIADWKKYFSLDKDKNRTREHAISLFPECRELLKRKCDHNRAESLLIAMYAADTYTNKISGE